MISLLVDVKVAPNHRQEFLDAILANARATVANEPGCHRFDVLEVDGQPNHFLFYEVYDDHDAFAAHKAAPHFADWVRARDAWVLEQKNTFADHVASLQGKGDHRDS